MPDHVPDRHSVAPAPAPSLPTLPCWLHLRIRAGRADRERTLKRSFLLALALAGAGQALSAESEIDLDLDPVIVTATRTAEPAKARAKTG